MMAAVSRDTTEGIDIPAEFQAYHSLGIPQCAIKFYWDKVRKHFPCCYRLHAYYYCTADLVVDILYNGWLGGG